MFARLKTLEMFSQTSLSLLPLTLSIYKARQTLFDLSTGRSNYGQSDERCCCSLMIIIDVFNETTLGLSAPTTGADERLEYISLFQLAKLFVVLLVAGAPNGFKLKNFIRLTIMTVGAGVIIVMGAQRDAGVDVGGALRALCRRLHGPSWRVPRARPATLGDCALAARGRHYPGLADGGAPLLWAA